LHRWLDRKAIRQILFDLKEAVVSAAPAGIPRSEHLKQLMRLCSSRLEEEWLMFLETRNYNLPSKAQVFIEECKTRPDFFYEEHNAAIYVDGPSHQFPERRQRDAAQTEAMEDRGYIVIRFGSNDDWDAIVKKYPGIFGGAK
jgi:very-short-patch-repair endonuclease